MPISDETREWRKSISEGLVSLTKEVREMKKRLTSLEEKSDAKKEDESDEEDEF